MGHADMTGNVLEHKRPLVELSIRPAHALGGEVEVVAVLGNKRITLSGV